MHFLLIIQRRMHFLVHLNKSKLSGAPGIDQQVVGSWLFDSSWGFQEDLVHPSTTMSVHQSKEKAKFSLGDGYPGDSEPPL